MASLKKYTSDLIQKLITSGISGAGKWGWKIWGPAVSALGLTIWQYIERQPVWVLVLVGVGVFLGLSIATNLLAKAFREGRDKMQNDDKPKPPEPTHSTHQTMTDSPGSVQNVGDHNTFNLGPQPRLVTPEQKEQVANFLRHHKPPDNTTIYVQIVTGMGGGTQEVINYAHQIADAINAGGWHAEIVMASMFNPVVYDLQSWITDPAVEKGILSALANANIGGILSPHRDPNFPNTIYVGPKL